MTQVPTLPLVTLILAVRNEARYIDGTLSAITAQTYPAQLVEIIVVDGMSDDGTLDSARAWSQRDSRIRVLANPDRKLIPALNIGIQAARGDVIGYVNGHSVLPHDYLERSIRDIAATGAWSVGARYRRIGLSRIQQAIGLAMSSPVGVGNALHNFSTESQWAETAFPGLWPKWVFDRIGVFDPQMEVNEDNELSERIRKAGGRIWYDADIAITYYPRSSYLALWRQFWGYGLHKVRVFQRHPTAIRMRQLVPSGFLLALGLTLLAGVAGIGTAWLILLLILGAYCGLIVVAGFAAGPALGPLVSISIAVMHVSYGFGMWAGAIRILQHGTSRST